MHGPRSRESADWTQRRLPWRWVGESQRPAEYTTSSWSRQCRSGDCLGVKGSAVCTRDLPARRLCRQGCDSRARTDRAKMPQTRMRMRPWLEMEIDSNKIPGLIWINKEEKLFQIPWKHAAKHGWELEKDACLFRNWAIHTGRYKKGEVQPDPKTWKANFRCAMNSLPDIEEVKDKSISKGSTAVRVYRMLPTSAKSQKKEKKPKIKTVKKSAEDIKAEETAEATNSIQLPDDHSGYAHSSYSPEAMEAENASLSLGLSACDMNSSPTEWRRPLDIAVPDSTNDLYLFQVSPITSSSDATDEDEDKFDHIYQQLLTANNDWQQTTIGGKGYFSNELSELCYLSDQVPAVDTTCSDMVQNDSKISLDFTLLESLRMTNLQPISCGM